MKTSQVLVPIPCVNSALVIMFLGLPPAAAENAPPTAAFATPVESPVAAAKEDPRTGRKKAEATGANTCIKLSSFLKTAPFRLTYHLLFLPNG